MDQEFGLWDGAWETVQDNPLIAIRLQEPLRHHSFHQFIRNQAARMHDGLHSDTNRILGRYVRPEHIAGRDVWPGELLV